MDNSELAELERGIRAALTDFGLDWVLADIEEGIKAKGRVDVVVPRGRKAEEQESLFAGDARPYTVPVPGYKGPTMVGDVPVEPADRVALAIDALHRIIVELPAIHEDAVNRLADSEDHDSVADDMIFLPDEDDSAQPVLSVGTVKASMGRRRQAEEFLFRLSDEVMR
jgi:hypothetical protein